MSLGYENRLDDIVPHGKFGDEEAVEVRTKMGSTVANGHVLSVLPFGLIVRESTGETRFYSESLYLFSSLEGEPPVVVQNQLNDTSLDARVNMKLISMGEAGDPTPDNTGAKPIDPDASDDEYSDNDGEKENDADSVVGGKKNDDDEKDDNDDNGKKKKGVANPDSSIDVEKLPKDIKDAIIKSDEMDEGQLNGVLGDVSDAAMKALKRAGLSETQLFGLVQKISDSVYNVLTGKNPSKG